MTADVRRLLDELHIAAARYIGYSMGARVGLQAVVDFPDRILRVVLGGLGVGGAGGEAEMIARALRGGEPESPSALSFQRFASGRSTNDLEALAACMEGLGHSPGFQPARLATITTPILLAVGERDEVSHAPAQLAPPSPTARLVGIPRRHHMGAL